MKPSSHSALSFLLLFVFFTNLPLLAFSDEFEQVVATNGNPIFPGGKYYIVPAIWGPTGGGVRLDRTGNSDCPVTVLQDYSEVIFGQPVKFTIPEISTGIIFTGTPLEIEFTDKPGCASSSKWLVFVDNEIGKACVGIGGPEDHPGQQTFSGTFSIKKTQIGYKFVFCVSGSSTCLDIGRYDNHEGGRRLNLTEHEPFEFVFIDAYNFQGIIKSVAESN